MDTMTDRGSAVTHPTEEQLSAAGAAWTTSRDRRRALNACAWVLLGPLVLRPPELTRTQSRPPLPHLVQASATPRSSMRFGPIERSG